MQVAKDVAKQLQRVSSHLTVFDRKRKQDTANRLQQRWQRWEISNFDYIMQVGLFVAVYALVLWILTEPSI